MQGAVFRDTAAKVEVSRAQKIAGRLLVGSASSMRHLPNIPEAAGICRALLFVYLGLFSGALSPFWTTHPLPYNILATRLSLQAYQGLFAHA